MDENSIFQRQIVQYLERVHVGGFLTGPHQVHGRKQS